MAVLAFVPDAGDGKIAKSSLEAVSYAAQVAASSGTTATAVTYGATPEPELAALGMSGATKVLVDRSLAANDAGTLTTLVEKAAAAEQATVIVFAGDTTGRAVAPCLSARLKAALAVRAVALPESGGDFRVRCSAFSGKAFVLCKLNTDVKIVSILPNSVPVGSSGSPAEVVAFDSGAGTAQVTVREKRKTEGRLPLPEAELVVSAGRGLKGPENWSMIEELAEALGAATACSRPVSDMGWRPHHEHVGQTGTAIRPNLYIAIGISGAIQHLAGVNGSKVIAVINKDPEAPFFKAADYGIVGDAFEVVPKLIAAAKKYRAG